MKPIPVACLVLIDHLGHLLATQRPNGKTLANLWEFPGGKVEANESPETALRRELIEELNLEVQSLTPLEPVTHPYDFATIQLLPFLARCNTRPTFHLKEHIDSRWIHLNHAHSLNWAPADLPVLHAIQSSLPTPCHG